MDRRWKQIVRGWRQIQIDGKKRKLMDPRWKKDRNRWIKDVNFQRRKQTEDSKTRPTHHPIILSLSKNLRVIYKSYLQQFLNFFFFELFVSPQLKIVRNNKILNVNFHLSFHLFTSFLDPSISVLKYKDVHILFKNENFNLHFHLFLMKCYQKDCIQLSR